MKKKYFIFMVAVIIAAGVAVNLQLNSQNEVSGIVLANLEALSSEGSDCHYNNGYTMFSNDDGSAYDCCMNWVQKLPHKRATKCN
jgi:hypothetical protein